MITTRAPLLLLLVSACAGSAAPAPPPPSASASTPQPATLDGGAATSDDDDEPENPALPRTLDRALARRQLRNVRLSIRENCARFLDPDLHADVIFDPATGKVKSVTLDSDRLGGVATCVKEKLTTISVPPFEGDGTLHVTLSPPAKSTKKVPRAF